MKTKYRLCTFGEVDHDGDLLTKEAAVNAATDAQARGLIESFEVHLDDWTQGAGWIEAVGYIAGVAK